jgi:hypothetical protein
MDNIKETRRYWKLKVAALYRSCWTIGFGRCYAPVIRLRGHDSEKRAEYTNAVKCISNK